MKSLQSRMVFTYLLLIVLVVSLLGAGFVALMWNYYYGSAQSSVTQRAEMALAQHSRSLASLSVKDQADYMLQHMSGEGIRLQLLDSGGSVRIDSDGFASDIRYTTADVRTAIAGSTGSWRGIDPYYGERVISVTVPVWNEARVIALLRYTAAIGEIDHMVFLLIRTAVIVGIFVVLLFLGLSMFLARRIVRPIRELTRAARHMADGDWRHCAVPKSNDEIGQLANTFNAMVTELNKREKLKDDFISSISHELRTPLTSIKGWSETLKEGEPQEDDEVQQGLSIISRETDRLSGLVEDLLDFSKLSAKTMGLHTELLDLNGPVKETVRQLAVRQEETKVKLLASLGKSPIIVQGDPNRLKQVLINIIDNAFKFTSAGGTIRITTSIQSDYALITVADTGCGISSEDLPQVTEKFYKANTVQGGSGLGLAICKEIVELHNGKLIIDSEPGAGTVVMISLPIVPEQS